MSRSEKQTTSVKKMFYLWACRTYSQKLFPGKLQWGVRSRSERRTFQSPVAPFDVTMVTTTKSKLATCILKGELCGVQVNIMLDSGSSVSLIRQDIARKITPVQVTKQSDSNKIKLVTAVLELMIH